MLLGFDGFRDPVALLDRDAILLFETINGREERETLTDGDDANVLESLVVEEDEDIARDAIGLEVSGVFGETDGGEPIDDLLF